MNLTGKDRITVEKNGEEIDVFNHVSVRRTHYVDSVNGHVTGKSEIGAGDNVLMDLDAMTLRVANYLQDEFNIDVRSREDIEVIDHESDEVTVL